MPSQSKSEKMLSRTSTMSVRLAPKQRYLVMLAAREVDATLTRFIEDAIMQSIIVGNSPHLLNEGFWDEHPAKRLFLLATGRPDLLSDIDRRIWRRAAKKQEVLSVNGAIDCAKLCAYWQQIGDEE